MTILVVEDDREVRELLIDYLRFRRFETYGAANIYEVRELLEEFTPDLLFLDPHLPKDVTIEFQELRRIFRLRKVILMTAHENYSNLMDKYGYEGCINKPFSLQELDAFLT